MSVSLPGRFDRLSDLEAESDTAGGVGQAVGIAAFQDKAEGVAYIEPETAETAVAESKLHLVRIETLRGDTGLPAQVDFKDPAQVPAQHETRSDREVYLIGTRHGTVAGIGAQLKTAVQMPGRKVRHGDLAGNQPTETGKPPGLDGNQLGNWRIRLGRKGGRGGSQDPEGRCKKSHYLFHTQR